MAFLVQGEFFSRKGLVQDVSELFLEYLFCHQLLESFKIETCQYFSLYLKLPDSLPLLLRCKDDQQGHFLGCDFAAFPCVFIHFVFSFACFSGCFPQNSHPSPPRFPSPAAGLLLDLVHVERWLLVSPPCPPPTFVLLCCTGNFENILVKQLCCDAPSSLP